MLVGITLAQRRGWLRVGWLPLALAVLGGVAVVGAGAVAVGGEPVSQRFVTSQLWQNYAHGLATSAGRPHLAYAGLRPTVGSMARYFPFAAFQALARPWLGESAAPLYLAAALENLLLLALLLAAAVAVARGRPGRLPPALVLALLLYCLLLAGLIGLSTPNLGTLHRYRAVVLPWLLWLLLQPDYARQLLRRLKIGRLRAGAKKAVWLFNAACGWASWPSPQRVTLLFMENPVIILGAQAVGTGRPGCVSLQRCRGVLHPRRRPQAAQYRAARRARDGQHRRWRAAKAHR